MPPERPALAAHEVNEVVTILIWRKLWGWLIAVPATVALTAFLAWLLSPGVGPLGHALADVAAWSASWVSGGPATWPRP
jgi:hypothetical protein